jgi:hypothetical protein
MRTGLAEGLFALATDNKHRRNLDCVGVLLRSPKGSSERVQTIRDVLERHFVRLILVDLHLKLVLTRTVDSDPRISIGQFLVGAQVNDLSHERAISWRAKEVDRRPTQARCQRPHMQGRLQWPILRHFAADKGDVRPIVPAIRACQRKGLVTLDGSTEGALAPGSAFWLETDP